MPQAAHLRGPNPKQSAFVSHKVLDQEPNWSTIENEAFAICVVY